jgi:DNA gyrase/topoisomerase IV subunit A
MLMWLCVQGIAVGIATKIPPHNLNEVVAALEALVQQPDISTGELLKYTPAPDFPTGKPLPQSSLCLHQTMQAMRMQGAN